MVIASKKCLLLLGVAMFASSTQVVWVSAAEESAPSSTEETVTTGDDTRDDDNAGYDADDGPCDTALCLGSAFLENDVVDSELPPPAIPDFSNGGILVYFHLYKTGGTSVAEFIVETKKEQDETLLFEDESKYVVIYNYNNGKDLHGFDILDSFKLVKDQGKTVFYNFDAEFPSNCPTMVEAAPLLDSWRKAAKAEGVPFFLTTVLREPLSHALSFFNFFHVVDYEEDEEDWNPFTGDLKPTEEIFLKTYIPNRLCHLMYDDVHGIFGAPNFALREGLLENTHHFMDEEELNRRNEPSHCDMEVVRKLLFGGTFDYVGVTERISTHILPMLTEIVFGDHTLAKDADKKMDITKLFTEDQMPPLKKDKLSDATREMVLRESSKDTALYEEARDRFAHWPSYLRHEDLLVKAKEICYADDHEDYDDETVTCDSRGWWP
jgi:hypothetical protein